MTHRAFESEAMAERQVAGTQLRRIRSFYGRDACLLARASGFGKPFSEAVRKRSSSAFSNRGASARKSGSRRAVAQVALGARRWFVRPLPRASVTGFSFLLLGVGSLELERKERKNGRFPSYKEEDRTRMNVRAMCPVLSGKCRC